MSFNARPAVSRLQASDESAVAHRVQKEFSTALLE
jgi:hypothetical protein